MVKDFDRNDTRIRSLGSPSINLIARKSASGDIITIVDEIKEKIENYKIKTI